MEPRPGWVDLHRRGWVLAAGLAGVSGLGGLALWNQRVDVRAGSGAEGSAASLAPGRFPQLTVHRIDGAREVLAAGATRVRVVNFWARWCGPCRRELPSLQRLVPRLGDGADGVGMELQTVALDDDLFALREYLRDVGLAGLPVWRLSPADAPPDLALGSLPQTFVVAPDARILARVAGAREWDRDDQVARLRAFARPGRSEG